MSARKRLRTPRRRRVAGVTAVAAAVGVFLLGRAVVRGVGSLFAGTAPHAGAMAVPLAAAGLAVLILVGMVVACACGFMREGISRAVPPAVPPSRPTAVPRPEAIPRWVRELEPWAPPEDATREPAVVHVESTVDLDALTEGTARA